MINNNLSNENRKDSILPPPEILVKYEELGIGDDLISLVKKEQEHRHLLQKKYARVYFYGQLFNFILSTLFIYEVFKLVRIEYTKEAYILFALFAALIIVVTIILKSEKRSTQRRRAATAQIRNRKQQLTRRRVVSKR